MALIGEARALPAQPIPDTWRFAMHVIEGAGAKVKPIKFTDLSAEAMKEWAGGEAQGAPWQCFFHDDTLYIDVGCNQQAIAHEAGHILAWVEDQCPDGFNYGIDPNVGNEAERIACEVEVFLLTTGTDWSKEELIRYHYDVGILVRYDPDDTHDPNDEDDHPKWHEASQAWEDFEWAIEEGRAHVSNFLG